MILNDKPNCQVSRILMSPRLIFLNRSENDSTLMYVLLVLQIIMMKFYEDPIALISSVTKTMVKKPMMTKMLVNHYQQNGPHRSSKEDNA
jgi:hypothetical protein